MTFSISRSTLATAILTTLIFCLPSAGLANGCQDPDLTGTSLSSAASGDTLNLSGTGFCDSAQEHFAWVWDGSQGAPIFVQQTNGDTLMGATVGPTPETVTGQMILWTGQSVALPDTILEAETGTYWIHDTRVFLQTDKNQGPTFTATAGTANGVTSTLVSGELRLNFAPSANLNGSLPNDPFQHNKAGGHGEGVSVFVVARTCGEPTGDGDNDDDGNNGSGHGVFVPFPIEFSARFQAGCFGTQGACTGTPTQFIAAAIENRFSNQGLEARIEGQEVVISHRSCPIQVGFATVMY